LPTRATPSAEIGHAAGQRGDSLRAKLADDGEGILAPRDEQAAGPHQIVPLRLVFAVAVEYLHTMVLPVRDIDPAIVIAGDVMDQVELAGGGSGLAPGEQQLAVRRVFRTRAFWYPSET
jgi:hypothetical protein